MVRQRTVPRSLNTSERLLARRRPPADISPYPAEGEIEHLDFAEEFDAREEEISSSRTYQLLDELLESEDDVPEPSSTSRYRWGSPLRTVLTLLVLGLTGFLIFSWISPQENVMELVSPAPSESILAPSMAPRQETLTKASTPATAQTNGQVQVHVAGAVKSPGLYRLKNTSRVGDAIDKAGGITQEGDLNQVNLAQPLVDGTQILVPVLGEKVLPPAGAGSLPPPMASSNPTKDEGPKTVNVNSASAQELEELPKIGPKLAAQIISYRESQGPFSSLEDLDQVPGIGPAMIENLAPLVSF